MRGRKPKATAVKEAGGAYIKNPQRKNTAEPKPPAGVPKMPSTISACEIAKAKWIETISLLAEMNVLSKADAGLLERFCLTYSTYLNSVADVRKNGIVVANGDRVTRNPAALEMHACEAELHKQTIEMGLTPSSRSRLKAIETTDDDDPFSELLSRIGRG